MELVWMNGVKVINPVLKGNNSNENSVVTRLKQFKCFNI